MDPIDSTTAVVTRYNPAAAALGRADIAARAAESAHALVEQYAEARQTPSDGDTVYGPGVYAWRFTATFPTSSAALGGPWPKTGAIVGGGDFVLSEPTPSRVLRDQLLGGLAGPADRQTTVTQFVISPSASF
ncbi:hypothetical protein [Streptomyces sp. NPDC088785]|uniref:hypothetical protein n=1 Tax=Streptomyces sp. NPDC088785 TaxID=3365897 RepID=UPI0037FC03F4